MGLLNHCLPILSTFGRSSFMFGKQVWIPTFFPPDTWKAVLSKLTEILPPQVQNVSPKVETSPQNLEKIRGKKFSAKLGFFKLFHWSRIMLFWQICRKRQPISWKNHKLSFLQGIVTFLLKMVPSPKQKFFSEKHLLVQKTSLKERARAKTAAARWSSFLNYQNGILINIYEMKGNLPSTLAFFTYTSQLHGFLHNIESSQFWVEN